MEAPCLPSAQTVSCGGHGGQATMGVGTQGHSLEGESPATPSPAEHTAARPWERCARGPASRLADRKPRLCHSAAFQTLPGPCSARQRPGNLSVWREARWEALDVSRRP